MSLQELKDAMKKEKLVFGSNSTLRNMKKGKTKQIFLANNCGKDIAESIEYYSKFSKVKISKINKPRSEISILCKKNFPVSVISY
jgi:ribosomal protein L30E|tara:strand:+ start:3124 stop:3378 length:255 start_codon:yes stop_codon:yes gene_type:complete